VQCCCSHSLSRIFDISQCKPCNPSGQAACLLQAAEAASLAAAHEDVAGAHSQQAMAAAEVEVDAVAERQPAAGVLARQLMLP
jgi:hypothetical protein